MTPDFLGCVHVQLLWLLVFFAVSMLSHNDFWFSWLCSRYVIMTPDFFWICIQKEWVLVFFSLLAVFIFHIEAASIGCPEKTIICPKKVPLSQKKSQIFQCSTTLKTAFFGTNERFFGTLDKIGKKRSIPKKCFHCKHISVPLVSLLKRVCN